VLWQDIRYGLRVLRRSPGFTAVAVLSLALGIGANTAIFSLLYTVMLRALPVEHPEQLVEFLISYPGDPPLNTFSRQSYEYYRDHNHVFAGIIAGHPSRFHVRGDNTAPETVYGESVAGNFFQMLGVRPAVGRLIRPEDDSMRTAVAVVSWSYWKSHFNLDPAILGRHIVVENVPVTIVGVTPREFSGLHLGIQFDIWVPQGAFDFGPLALVARLRPGVSLAQARAEMAVLFRFTLDERTRASNDPVMRQLKFAVEPAGTGLSTALRDRFAKPLVALMAVVALLLLIACTNVAGLLLARGAAREREIAVRVSLGASRVRLLRQMFTESLMLSVAGGALGVFLAYFGAAALVRITTSGRFIGPPPRIEIHVLPDWHVLLFTCGVALLTGVLFGMAPAWSAFASAPVSSLRNSGRAGETRFRRTFGKILVIAQVALSMGLVTAAGLFIGNLSNLEHTDLGFRRDHVLLMTLDPAHSGSGAEELFRAYRDLLARMERVPGVRSATISDGTPISGGAAESFAIVEGYQERPEDRRYVFINWVGPKYFETFGTPLLAGRDFSFQDHGGPRVAIINQAMARYYFASRNPIGKHVALEHDWKGFGADQPYEIIGVVGDAKYSQIREAPPRTIYFNAFQFPGSPSNFSLSTSVNPLPLAPAARRLASEVLKDVAVTRITTLADQVDATIVPERLMAFVSGVFGSLGALLTAIGIYGLLAYTVARRINEIGIRMALGATRGDVTRMVLRDALAMVCAGLACGLPLAIWGKRFAASLIPDLTATSSVPMALGAAAMMAVALLAAYIPARRAAHVEPMEALRHE
jgi:putative ABC transport system permease protein